MQYKGHDKELVLITFKHLCFVLFVAKTKDGERICLFFLHKNLIQLHTSPWKHLEISKCNYKITESL